jgi:hypothetical protein
LQTAITCDERVYHNGTRISLCYVIDETAVSHKVVGSTAERQAWAARMWLCGLSLGTIAGRGFVPKTPVT